jgi:hypothetical protein
MSSHVYTINPDEKELYKRLDLELYNAKVIDLNHQIEINFKNANEETTIILYWIYDDLFAGCGVRAVNGDKLVITVSKNVLNQLEDFKK